MVVYCTMKTSWWVGWLVSWLSSSRHLKSHSSLWSLAHLLLPPLPAVVPLFNSVITFKALDLLMLGLHPHHPEDGHSPCQDSGGMEVTSSTTMHLDMSIWLKFSRKLEIWNYCWLIKSHNLCTRIFEMLWIISSELPVFFCIFLQRNIIQLAI